MEASTPPPWSLEALQDRAAHDEAGWRRQYGDEWIAIADGEFPRSANGYALVNSLTVKSGAGTLYGFSGDSNRASAQFIHVYDLANITALAAASVPEIVIRVAATTTFSYDAGRHGRRFSRGIVIANSTTEATYTAGAADTWFDVQYV